MILKFLKRFLIDSNKTMKSLKLFSNIDLFHRNFFSCMKMFKNSSANYYQKSKESLQKKAREMYQDLYEEEKTKERQNSH